MNFLKQLEINFTNVFQNLGDVCECATKEGAYCGPVVGQEDGENRYMALEFEETEAPWDNYSNSELGMSEEEFMELVLGAISDLIDKGALEEDFDVDEALEDEEGALSFEEGLGI